MSLSGCTPRVVDGLPAPRCRARTSFLVGCGSAARSQRGFTLVEVMTAIALLATFSAAALMLTATVVGNDRRNAGYTRDVLGSQNWPRAFEADARAAQRVAVTGDGVTLRGPGGEVVYRLRDGVLTRLLADRCQTLAQDLAEFTVIVEGALVHARATLATRDRSARRRAAVATTVCLRAAEEAP